MKTITTDEQRTILLDMLKTLDRFCEDNGIRYFLASGTLLGAIRHKGFIPWDDDIDVVMPRNDYERFITSFSTLKPYSVISYKTNPEYYLQFAKVISENTVMREPVDSSLEIGIYIDVFPLDNMSDNYEMAKKLFDRVGVTKKKLWAKNLVWYDGRPLYQNLVVKVIKALAVGKREAMLETIDRQSTSFRSNEFSRYIGVVCSGTYGYKEIMESAWYEDYVKVPFETLEVRAPIGYEAILTQMYGNYMELPPKEKQVSHHRFEVWYKGDPDRLSQDTQSLKVIKESQASQYNETDNKKGL